MTETTTSGARVAGHYEVDKTPFGRSYKWRPSQVTLECNCSEELTLYGTSTRPVCSRCGTDHSGVITDIKKGEGQLGQEAAHPWHYDTQEQAEQNLKDEATHAENSPWRYNDITSRGTDDERNVQ
jgi:hypothetical protein